MILAASEEELVTIAKGRALSWADSSRLEGLLLDESQLEIKLLTEYNQIRDKAKEFKPC